MATNGPADPEPEAAGPPVSVPDAVPEPVATPPPDPAGPAYPVWLYHQDFPDGMIVESAEHEQRLGSGWVRSKAELAKDA